MGQEEEEEEEEEEDKSVVRDVCGRGVGIS